MTDIDRADAIIAQAEELAAVTDIDKQVEVVRAALTSRDETHYPSNAGRLEALEALASWRVTHLEEHNHLLKLEAENTRLRRIEEAARDALAIATSLGLSASKDLDATLGTGSAFDALRSALTKEEAA